MYRKYARPFASLTFSLLMLLTLVGCSTGTSSTAAVIASPPVNAQPVVNSKPSSPKAGSGSLKVSVIDVGQGDSILVQFPDGENMLVDAGTRASGDAVVKYLSSQKVSKLDLLVATHPHEDHIGGMQDVLSAYTVSGVWDSGFPHGSGVYTDFLKTISNKKIPYTIAKAGMSKDFGQVRIDVLAPTKRLGDVNNNSIVMRVVYGKISFLLTGDMEEEERASIGSWPKSTALKVAHHGSSNGTDEAFLTAVSPSVAVISVAKQNDYGHPSPKVISLLKASKVDYAQTFDGTVTLTTDGSRLSVSNVNASPGITGKNLANETNPPTESGDVTVHITKAGMRYHAAGCRYLARSDIPISLSEAEAKGYTPCSVCGGVAKEDEAPASKVTVGKHKDTGSSPSVSSPSNGSTNSDTVHITRTGSKYHRAGCRYLSRSDIPVSRSEAQSRGLSPCSVCSP